VRLYLDSAYIAKCYLNDPDSFAVRTLVQDATDLWCSSIAVAEVSCAVHRRFREGVLSRHQANQLITAFHAHLDAGSWNLEPLTSEVLEVIRQFMLKAGKLVFLRAGDTIQLASAHTAGFSEIWSNDRHLLNAAPHFGLRGRSVRT
jgi:predicted nucleic acid-binding protein